ncbi:bifunctional 5,10-methylenetetrahydrofolate dehydrogenase/5,10-methenyltetrahydrofolate cyclohydrolase [Candidatus Peregrinibacteria bacterium]|nr:bifunctional 5,10-methylenetetrahydrofolate dehydrogenase/5,10-methenyltetrahydrofolate cyclohydrolase [Candidatus Peregrinibacteria bacterium]
MQILDGRKVASLILSELTNEVVLLNKKNVQPKLVIISVGENPASALYIRAKQHACKKIGILSDLLKFPENLTTEALISTIQSLNTDSSVHGIIVQLPLPKTISTPLVIRAILPKKDVDGFHAYNLGKMFLSTEFEDLAPSTPSGIVRLLEHYEITFEGKEVTVVGHSNIVGKPISVMLLNRNATVTICHIYTKDLAKHTRNAEILIVAVGKPGLITADMVRSGVIAVDVGINRLPDGSVCGDIDFLNVSKKATFITPVPGGVGPMTVACLLENVVKSAKRLNI